jgi:hypothetical protein
VGPIPEGKENQTPKANGVQAPAKPQKKGPPPPSLPALSSFGVSEEVSSFASDDLFKNIK